MEELKLYYAKVTSINDPDKKGKIQVRLLPQMKDVKESLLPWYDPFVGTGNNLESSFHPPEVGTNVFVMVESSTFRKGFYLFPTHIEGFFDYTGIDLSSVTELSGSDYPNISFTKLNTGTILFHNIQNGDVGVLHHSGTYQIIDSNGNIYISQKDGNKVSISNTGTIIKDSNNNEINFSSSGLAINDKNGNTVVMGTTSVKINNNLEVLQ